MKYEFMSFEEKLVEGRSNVEANVMDEDNGCTKIAEITARVYNPMVIRAHELLKKELPPFDEGPGIFVRLISWDPSEKHKDMKRLLEASKVRVVIEIIE